MRIFLFALGLWIAGCATPASMEYQRSEYNLDQVGNLMVSTSPDFRHVGVATTPNEVQLRQSWLIQNKSEKPATIQLSKAMATYDTQSLPLKCTEAGAAPSELGLPTKTKVVIDCYLAIPRASNKKNDLLVTLSLPTSEGTIATRKLVRAEDFQ